MGSYLILGSLPRWNRVARADLRWATSCVSQLMKNDEKILVREFYPRALSKETLDAEGPVQRTS